MGRGGAAGGGAGGGVTFTARNWDEQLANETNLLQNAAAELARPIPAGNNTEMARRARTAAQLERRTLNTLRRNERPPIGGLWQPRAYTQGAARFGRASAEFRAGNFNAARSEMNAARDGFREYGGSLKRVMKEE